MTVAEMLVDTFGRIREGVHGSVDGLTPEQLAARIDDKANSIAWLVWHLTRVQDDHVAAAAGTEQVWTASGWGERFGLKLPLDDTGYGHSPEQVAAVTIGEEMLHTYHDAVYDATCRFLLPLADSDLDRIVDERWDPPVTLGVRLVSVIADDLQHTGQAAYVRGIVERKK